MTDADRLPRSCDTFVVLPPASQDGAIIFGKNSDRPSGEVQEVVHISSNDYPAGSKVECTYIEIDQVEHTYAVILSKPSWMWGAEMGANEHGLCIGNEAVWTKEQSDDDLIEKLLGMDLVRLGLERAKTAKEALDVITSLLKTHGQGGVCSDTSSSFVYHNSFLIADGREAWILETAGAMWAAEHVTVGVRNISNQLSIRTKIDAMHPDLKKHAEEAGYWKPGDGEFDFAKVYSEDMDSSCGRYARGKQLLEDFSRSEKFEVSNMFQVLRDDAICMDSGTTGSQVSKLSPPGADVLCCHWFTATPNPSQSFFKPFVFCNGASIGDKTKSPEFGDDDPRKKKPRFQKAVDRKYPLYKAHERMTDLIGKKDPRAEMLKMQMAELESNCLQDVGEVCSKFDEKSCGKIATIFKHMVDLEINFYNM